MNRELYRTLRLLRVSGILGAAVRRSDGHYHLWIGDTSEGVRESSSAPAHDAAAWLVSRALQHYPRSDFAKVRAFLDGTIAAAARSRA